MRVKTSNRCSGEGHTINHPSQSIEIKIVLVISQKIIINILFSNVYANFIHCN